jgi:hypothetical protein
MISDEEEKPSLDDLIHFGVRGMRWGHRKARDNSPNESYTSRQRTADSNFLGKRAVKRINRDINSGKTRKQALKSAVNHNRRLAVGYAAAAAALVVIGTTKFERNLVPVHGGESAAKKVLALNGTKTLRFKLLPDGSWGLGKDFGHY